MNHPSCCSSDRKSEDQRRGSVLPGSAAGTRGRWTPGRCGSPPVEPGPPADWGERKLLYNPGFKQKEPVQVVLVLTSVRSDSAGSPGWEQRSGGSGRSPRPRYSSPRFQTRWVGRNNVRGCEPTGRCPGPSCCSGSSGNAEERVKTTALIKKWSPSNTPVDVESSWISPLQQNLD